MRTDFAETFKDVKQDFEKLKLDVEAFIDKYVQACAEPILACKNEAEFIKAMADLGDKAYKGNFLTEKIDDIVFTFLLKKIDKYVLDKYLGENWFEKLQEKARSFKTVISIDRELE